MISIAAAPSLIWRRLGDLYSFWERYRDQEVDDAALREFRWAVEEAYEELAQRFGNILAGNEAEPSDGEG